MYTHKHHQQIGSPFTTPLPPPPCTPPTTPITNLPSLTLLAYWCSQIHLVVIMSLIPYGGWAWPPQACSHGHKGCSDSGIVEKGGKEGVPSCHVLGIVSEAIYDWTLVGGS